MPYDPFLRGPFPVGVRTVALHDASRDRRLTSEVWYPASAAHTGADLDPATRDRYPLAPGFPPAWQAAVRDAAPRGGRAPLAVFSHGFAGHRRQSTFFATHLASHGWVVASLDHAGNTFVDLAVPGRMLGEQVWTSSMADRPRDVRFLIDAAADGRLGVTEVDTSRVAMSGHSFGGWTSVRVIPDEPRIAAAVALAPAIGHPVLRDALTMRWDRPVPVLVLACERDSILPLAAIVETTAALPEPKRLVTIANTDHMHFCDAARNIHELFRQLPFQLVPTATPLPPFDQLAPASHGLDAACGLGLAWLDAAVRDVAEARAFVAGDLGAALRARGIGTA